MTNIETMSLPPLPTDVVPLRTQVSGHFYGTKSTKLGMLELRDGTLVKPLIPPKGDKELLFYEDVYDRSQDNGTKLALKEILAEYYGVWTTPLHPDVRYIKLKNITNHLNVPCVMDIKVGPHTWQPGDEEKKARELAKYPPQQQVGFRVLGIMTYSNSTGKFTKFDHMVLRSLMPEDIVPKGIAVFLNLKEDQEYKRHILNALLAKLYHIQEWFETQTLYHFYASSLLFVYEGKPNQNLLNGHASSDEDLNKWMVCDNLVDIRLIDFTHVFPAEGKRDENYVTGVKRIIEHFKMAARLCSNNSEDKE